VPQRRHPPRFRDAGRLGELFAKGLCALVVDDHQHRHGIVTAVDLADVRTQAVDPGRVEAGARA
jgi:hypothetical protein